MRCKICAVPGEKLAFYFFPFERPLLQNCIMHSSICTNGYFFVMLHWHPRSERSWRDVFCLKAIRLTGAGLTHSLSAVTNVLFTLMTQNYASITAGWTGWQANLHYIFFSSFIDQINELKSWTFTKWVLGVGWGQGINKKQSWTIELWW